MKRMKIDEALTIVLELAKEGLEARELKTQDNCETEKIAIGSLVQKLSHGGLWNMSTGGPVKLLR